MLKITNLFVEAEGKKILKDISLTINPGELHVLMGPNGAGKTSLVMTLMGKKNYKMTGGSLTLDGKEISKLGPDERAKSGLFISFQKPPEIPGVSLHNLLRAVNVLDLEDKIKKETTSLQFNEDLLSRSWENFSGGEAKKIELFQAKILNPLYLILDEIDSGLDIDALKIVVANLKNLTREKKAGILLITHNPRILKFLKPDFAHILVKGKLVKSDGPEILAQIEKKGYQWLTKN